MTNTVLSKYLIIGSGRMARHLLQYFSLILKDTHDAKFIIDHWIRTQGPELLQEKIKNCTHILVAISDSSLSEFIQNNLISTGKIIIHFSGALNIDGTISTHPLMSFSHDLYSFEVYKQIHFAVTGTSTLQNIFPMFENEFTEVLPKDKALYHAYCVMSGNLPVILWSQILKELEKLQFPPHILDLYLNQVLQNFIHLRDKALTGPIARKDQVTIQKNIEALPQPEFKKIYQLFTEIPL